MDRSDLSGQTIAGRYRVLRRLGMGGMGAVYLAQHVESLQHYALKTLHEEVAEDRLAVERFLREARAAAALRSKNVVKVVDANMNHLDDRGHPLPFLVMELLEGANLEQLVVRQGPLAPEEVVWVLRGVARALDTAHQKGIVHRDLKPENVFLAFDEDGEPVAKVCDFGIAKLAGEAANGLMSTGALGTQTGTTVGTPMYMAPEQARSSTDVVVQTDQWPVALIAFKALTGREYFSTARSTAELLLKIVHDPLEPPSVRLSSLSPAFDAWFFRSTRRDPSERFASAGQQVQELAEALGVDEPRPPKIPRVEAQLATAETVDASALGKETLPAPSLANTTAAPSSRTMGGRGEVTSAPPLRPQGRRGLVPIAIGGVLLLGLVGGGLLMRGRGEPVAASSSVSTASAAPSPTPTTVATAAPTPSVVPSATVTAVVSATATAPTTTVKAIPTGTGKVKPPSTTTTPTATAPTAVGKSKLPKGASCSRSSECASGFCVSEECQ